jgi:hypothetical protein
MRPSVGGARAAQPGEPVALWVVGHHARGGNLAYRFDFGDGSEPEWGPELVAGDTFRRTHCFEVSGAYGVRVQARDEAGLVSGEAVWTVLVQFDGPEAPQGLSGPGSAYQCSLAVFAAAAGHVRAESVSLQFGWDTTAGAWTRFVAPGSLVRDSWAFSSAGVHAVRARAQDRAGNVSPWCVPETVVVLRLPVSAPTDLSLAACSSVRVRLRWQVQAGADSVRSLVLFRPVGEDSFGLVADLAEASYVHDPRGLTGDYAVAACRGSDTAFAAETLSTVPVRQDTAVVGELNADSASGWSWDRATGAGSRVRMQDSSGVSVADWYFTDFGPGRSGPFYYVVSPMIAPDDPGGGVPAGAWRHTRMVAVASVPDEPLPEYDSLYYQNAVDVTAQRVNVAVHTPDGYYALVTALGPDPVSATVRVVTWFQRVPGLRLIAHVSCGPCPPAGPGPGPVLRPRR